MLVISTQVSPAHEEMKEWQLSSHLPSLRVYDSVNAFHLHVQNRHTSRVSLTHQQNSDTCSHPTNEHTNLDTLGCPCSALQLMAIYHVIIFNIVQAFINLSNAARILNLQTTPTNCLRPVAV